MAACARRMQTRLECGRRTRTIRRRIPGAISSGQADLCRGEPGHDRGGTAKDSTLGRPGAMGMCGHAGLATGAKIRRHRHLFLPGLFPSGSVDRRGEPPGERVVGAGNLARGRLRCPPCRPSQMARKGCPRTHVCVFPFCRRTSGPPPDCAGRSADAPGVSTHRSSRIRMGPVACGYLAPWLRQPIFTMSCASGRWTSAWRAAPMPSGRKCERPEKQDVVLQVA